MKFIIGMILGCLACALSVAAESYEEIDAIFSKWDTTHSPGCSVAIARDGEILYSKGFGVASLEYGVPITPSTVFHVASVSKQFAAFAILLLQDEGKLSIDDEIHQYLPELPDFGVPIKIHHLIHHTSGLRDQWSLLSMSSWRMADVITTDDVVRLMRRQKELNFTPGERHVYCNTGYTLLGLIVKEVSGKSLKDFCQERIFDTLGMSDTHFHDDVAHIVKNRADTYAPFKRGFQRSVLSFSTVGATSLFTTVEDQMKWLDNFRTHAVGSEAVHEAMLVPGVLNNGQELAYASGVSVGSYKGVPIISHGGADAGYRSMVATFPKQGISIAVHANVASFNSGGALNGIADIVLADFIEESTEQNAEKDREGFIELTKGQLGVFRGSYVNSERGALRRINVAKDQLRLFLSGEPPILLSPVSSTVFRPTSRAESMEVRFSDFASAPKSMTVSIPGSPPMLLLRAGKKQTDEEYLSGLSGRYYSDELDVFWSLSAGDKVLLLNRRKYPQRTLFPRYEDGFASDGSEYHFTRSTEDVIDGFRVTAGRVQGIRFDKVDH